MTRKKDHMGKIYCIMGRSASGKNSIFKKLKQRLPEFRVLVGYTTRPIRTNETDGEDYFFISEKYMGQLQNEGKAIEQRTYHTACGKWCYATILDGQVDLSRHSYLMIGTPETYGKIKNYFGTENVKDIYIEVDNGILLQRAIERERCQKEPKYVELCRRFISDENDFSEHKLQEAGITHRFQNIIENTCTENILDYILATCSTTEKR